MYNVQSFHISVENSKTGIFLFNEKTMSLHFDLTYAREVYIFFIMKIRKKSDASCEIEIKFEKYLP